MMRRHMELLPDCRFSVSSYGIAAGYAGWLLRSLGAPVEHRSALDPEGIGAFLGQGATFAADPFLSGEPGGTLITDAPVSKPTEALLRELARDRRVIWVTPWGLGNEWSELPASDLALYAAGGWMSAVGEPAREPLAPPGGQCRFVAGLFAAIAALEPVANPAAAAPGLVDVPVIEAVAATLIYDSVGFQYYGHVRGRSGARYSFNQPTIATLPCNDGHIGMHIALHPQWVTLANLIGHPEIVHDPRFEKLIDRSANTGPLDAEYILPWLARRTRWEVYHELQAARIPSSALPDMAEVLASPQLNARGAFDMVTTPSGRDYRVPGAPVRVNAEAGPEPTPAREPGGPWRPGALRVIDFSMGWAGPMVTFNLASMGADVIKVESHAHFDWWRGSRPPGDGDGLALHERSHVFNSTNRGKRGISLDLTTARGRAIALDLIAGADVMVENYAAGVIEKLGLTWATVSERNPRLIMLRQPGFGATGPESHYVVFGNTIEGMSGLSSLVGYEGGPPTMLSNALGDPVSGLGGTIAVLAALNARTVDGKGRMLECAQLEGFLPMVSEALISWQRTGEMPRRLGNRRPGHEPSGAFAAGDGRWFAVDVESDEHWARLATSLGDPATDARYATVAGRESHREVLSRLLEDWLQRAGLEAAIEACRSAGIPASPVLHEGDVLAIEPLVASGFWQGMDREPIGFHLYPTVAYHRDGARPLTPTPAPHLGEHTDEVLAALGYPVEERELLAASGVTGPVPAAVSG